MKFDTKSIKLNTAKSIKSNTAKSIELDTSFNNHFHAKTEIVIG
ncbi:24209_t:CDS:1, partial [Dentiscutata erythropus]